ncbi:MAG: hypothetical protein O8C66_09330 [Candidatus Methanoperedens sp.]|nr:hypothetical protein [Candidatus Methanoperedens sp.]MCZ7370696.1 hypothetical protein [Candidatus Methanoperedens sp.]
MKLAESSAFRVAILVSPALFILILTVMISLVTGHPQGLFLSRSIRAMLVRFVLVTIIFIAPVLILPRLLALVVNRAKNEGRFGQFVKAASDPYPKLSKLDAWVIRPLQGIGLSMIFAERLVNLLEFLPVRLVLFFMGSALVSLFLSVVWGLDDLGIRIYSRRTGEVYMAGRSIGTVLPLIGGAIGISSLFHLGSPLDALTELFEIVMVLYPSYLFFVIFHQEFIRKRMASLSERLLLKRIETNLR